MERFLTTWLLCVSMATLIAGGDSSTPVPHFATPPIEEDTPMPNLPEPDLKITDFEGKVAETFHFRTTTTPAPEVQYIPEQSAPTAEIEQPQAESNQEPELSPVNMDLPNKKELMEQAYKEYMIRLMTEEKQKKDERKRAKSHSHKQVATSDAEEDESSGRKQINTMSVMTPQGPRMMPFTLTTNRKNEMSPQQMMEMMKSMQANPMTAQMMSAQSMNSNPMMSNGMPNSMGNGMNSMGGLNGMMGNPMSAMGNGMGSSMGNSMGGMSAMNPQFLMQLMATNPQMAQMLMNQMIAEQQKKQMGGMSGMNSMMSNNYQMGNNPMSQMNSMNSMGNPMAQMNAMNGMSSNPMMNMMKMTPGYGQVNGMPMNGMNTQQAQPPYMSQARTPTMGSQLNAAPPPQVAPQVVEEVTIKPVAVVRPAQSQVLQDGEITPPEPQPEEVGQAGPPGPVMRRAHLHQEEGDGQGHFPAPSLDPGNATDSPDYEAQMYQKKLDEVALSSQTTPAPSLEDSEFMEQILRGINQTDGQRRPKRYRKPHFLVKAAVRKLDKEHVKKSKWLSDPPPEFCYDPILIHDECEKKKKKERRWSYSLEDGTCFLYDDPCPAGKKNSFSALSACISNCWRQMGDAKRK